jgi:hypothetical protein
MKAVRQWMGADLHPLVTLLPSAARNSPFLIQFEAGWGPQQVRFYWKMPACQGVFQSKIIYYLNCLGPLFYIIIIIIIIICVRHITECPVSGPVSNNVSWKIFLLLNEVLY